MKELVCITCPNSCRMQAELEINVKEGSNLRKVK